MVCAFKPSYAQLYSSSHPLHSQIFAFSCISLSGVKCQHATLASHIDSYLPASKKRCLDIVSSQSSVKINQISLDESGEHVGICSEDGKVRSLRSSLLVTDPWVCREGEITNQCSSSSIIHPQTHLIKLYANAEEIW